MTYYLGLGSNMGDRAALLRAALQHIDTQVGRVECVSSFLETEPWGFDSPHPFLNAAARVSTTMQPVDVLRATQDIERSLGRTHKSVDGHYADRTIDIDLLAAVDEQGRLIRVDTPILKLPHPLISRRPFVLIPLREINGEWIVDNG